MKRLLTILAATGLVALIPASSVAGPILNDPIIGVRGGDFFSAPITTTSPLLFTDPCPADLSLYLCLDYRITSAYDAGIFSIVLHIANTSPGHLEDDLVFSHPDDTSDSFDLEDLGDNRVRLTAAPVFSSFSYDLSSYEPSHFLFQCPNSPSSTAEGTHPCGEGEDLLIDIKPTPDIDPALAIFSSSVEQINGASPVPEPGTMLLVGTGIAAAVRRLRRKTA